MITHSGGEILRLPMGENDAEAELIGDYLIKLLLLVWSDGESFNGKRPFGNSGWDDELYGALVRGGVIAGTFDPEYDGLDECHYEAGNEAIKSAIHFLTWAWK